MGRAPLPQDEAARLEALDECGILDTLPEQAYDDITHLASIICGTPIALMSLIDDKRQWFKSRFGLDTRETSREFAFCAHAILQSDVFVVPDAATDPRFADNPLVAAEPNIRFYAGAPLITEDGNKLGTLCVIDRTPRELSKAQKTALAALARQVMAQLELRRKLQQLEQTAAKQAQAEVALRASQERFNAFMDHSPALAFMKDAAGRFVYVNDPFVRHFKRPLSEYLGRTDFDLWPEAAAAQFRANDLAVLKGGVPIEIIETMPDGAGNTTFWLSFKFPLEAADGHQFLAGMAIDVTRRQCAEAEVRLQKSILEAQNEASADGILVISSAGKVLSFNGRFLELWGIAADAIADRTRETVGQLVLDKIANPEQFVAALTHLRTHESAEGHAEIELKDGRTFDYFSRPIQSSDGIIYGRVWFTRDISERKAVERMKTEFISTVSHELRTPLTSIRGSLGLIAGGVVGALPEKARPLVDIALQNSDRLVRLINDILDIEKFESGRMEFHEQNLELMTLIEQAVAENTAYGAQFGVEFVITATLPGASQS